MAKDDIFVTEEITNKDIHDTLTKVLEQTTRHNGRMTKIENSSIGLWISNHPFKFAFVVFIFAITIIGDAREGIWDFIKTVI